jgi:hypothetical protein
MSCGGPALSHHGHRAVTQSDETLGVMKTAGEALCGVLRAAMAESPDTAEGIGSVQDRAAAALYFLLLEHSVDQHGRCRSCRRPGATVGKRRRRCRVHMKAEFWLLQPRPPRFASAATSDFGRPARPQLSGHGGRIPLTAGPVQPTPPASPCSTRGGATQGNVESYGG